LGPPDRKLQARGSRLAEFVPTEKKLGDQIVRNFRRKNQLAILHFNKRKFLIIRKHLEKLVDFLIKL